MPGFRERLKKAETRNQLTDIWKQLINRELSAKAFRRCKKIFEQKMSLFEQGEK